TFELAFNQFYDPLFYRDLAGADAAGQARAWNRYAAVYLPAVILVVAFTAGGGPLLARIMVAGAYRETTIRLVGWAALIEGLRAAGSLAHHLSVARVDMRIFWRAGLAGALAAASGVVLLAQREPLFGTAAALGIAGALALG